MVSREDRPSIPHLRIRLEYLNKAAQTLAEAIGVVEGLEVRPDDLKLTRGEVERFSKHLAQAATLVDDEIDEVNQEIGSRVGDRSGY